MKNYSNIRLLALVSFLLINIQCSNESQKSSISIQFKSKVNSASTTNIEHIFINVSGLNSPLQVFEWECDKQNCSNISFETQSGEARLIQLLLITEDANFVQRMNYGDVNAQLKSGDNVITINLSEIGNFNAEARVMGRYIPSATHLLSGKELTGDLVVTVPVGSSKPDMRLMKSEIFGGWFNIFVLDNVGFKFLFSGHDKNGLAYTNQPLFNDLHDALGLKISSNGLQSNTNQRVRYSSALTYYEQRENGVFQGRPFTGKIIGYFGQNPDSRTLCSKAISGPTLFDGANGKSRLCKTVMGSACTDYFRWSDIDLSNAGSVTGASNTCAGASSSEMEIDFDNLGSGDKELVPFVGPFTKDSILGQNEIVKLNTSTGELRWLLNSGVYLSAGIEVFTRSISGGFNYDAIRDHDDGLLCEKLVQQGFVSKGVISSNPGSVILPAAELSSSNLKVALCPRKQNGSYYRRAFYNGGEQGPSTPSRLSFKKVQHIDGFSGDIHTNVCYPFSLELQDSNGNRTSSSTAISVNLISSDANNLFYGNLNDCENSNANFTSTSLNNSTIIYFKPTAAPGVSYSVQVTDVAAVLTASNIFNMFLTAPPSLSYVKIVPSFYRALELEAALTEDCVPFNVAGFSSGNELVPFGSFTVNLNMAQRVSPGDVQVFSNQVDCKNLTNQYTAATPLPNALNESLLEVWVRVPAVVSTVSNLLSSCTGTCTTQNIDIINPGPFNHMYLDKLDSGPHVGSAGDCVKFKIGAYDQHKPNSYPTNFPSSGVFNLSTNYTFGTFYSDACSSASSSLGVSGGSTFAEFYFGWPGSSTAGSFNLFLDDVINNRHPSYNLTIQ